MEAVLQGVWQDIMGANEAVAVVPVIQGISGTVLRTQDGCDVAVWGFGWSLLPSLSLCFVDVACSL